jgi:hypothetical protein
MSTQLCKNRFFKQLIGQRKVSFGMNKAMVESAWLRPWSLWKSFFTGEETWQWGSPPHSRVVFGTDGLVKEIFSVAHHRRGESWKR